MHPDLVKVVKRAIQITKQDFTIFDGLRTEEEQEANVEKGVSQTMESKHLPQDDGFSHAVDTVPYMSGKLKWDMVPILVIAEAMPAPLGKSC